MATFSNAQIAAFLRDNKFSAADALKIAPEFNLTEADINNAWNYLNDSRNLQSIFDASAAYKAAAPVGSEQDTANRQFLAGLDPSPISEAQKISMQPGWTSTTGNSTGVKGLDQNIANYVKNITPATLQNLGLTDKDALRARIKADMSAMGVSPADIKRATGRELERIVVDAFYSPSTNETGGTVVTGGPVVGSNVAPGVGGSAGTGGVSGTGSAGTGVGTGGLPGVGISNAASGINGRKWVDVPLESIPVQSSPTQYQSRLIETLRNSSPSNWRNPGLKKYTNDLPPTSQSIYELIQSGKKLPQIQEELARAGVSSQDFSSALDDRLGQAIYESYSKGSNFPDIKQGAIQNFGATENQFNSALDKRLAQAISQSIAQGFDVNLTRQGAIEKLGISDEDFNRALGIYNNSQNILSPSKYQQYSAPENVTSSVNSINQTPKSNSYSNTNSGGVNDGRDGFMGMDYSAPSGQTIPEQLASAGSTYGNLLGGMLPGGMMANLASGAYIDSKLNDAALNGGYTGMYTGDAAFGGRPNNTTVAGAFGPLSGDAWGGFNGFGGYDGFDPGGIGPR